MKRYLRHIIITTISIALLIILFRKEESTAPSVRDYEEICQSGVLKAVTEYNSLSYHAIEADSMAGFHYELLKAFTKEKGLDLELTPCMSTEERRNGVLSGKFDLLANDVLIYSGNNDSLLFTVPILLSKQVLVQRKPSNTEDSLYIKKQLDLAGKTLHIVQGSPSKHRIANLSNEIGDTIYIKEIEKYGAEQLLAMVAHGDIDYAVCDENIALANIRSYPQLDIETPISFTQFYSWGVNKKSTALLDTLNVWLKTYKESQAFKKLRRKYYKN